MAAYDDPYAVAGKALPPRDDHPLLGSIRELIEERDRLREEITYLHDQLQGGLTIIAQAQPTAMPSSMAGVPGQAGVNARYS